jgi:hypothetical protein
MDLFLVRLYNGMPFYITHPTFGQFEEPKWSNFFPPITMKLTRIVSIVCLSTVLNFQMKKLTGRSSFSAQHVKKFSI